MTFSSPTRPNAPAMLAIAVLHAALFSALWAQRYRSAPQLEGKVLEPVQWLLPLAAPPAVKQPAPDAAAPAVATRRTSAPRASVASRAPITPSAASSPADTPPLVAAPAPISASAPVSSPASPPPAAPAPATAPNAADPFDLANTAPAPASEALLRRQDWGAGKADHALRGGKLSALVRPTNTLQAGLERAFRDAGEAVPPKWFSAPEIREMSVPEGRMRMYKIRTMMGTYCFYKPDPSLQAGYDYKLMTCPREK